MGEVSEKVLMGMVDAIVREVDPEKIILFGSRARGDMGAYSDVDLLIVESEPFHLARSRRKEMMRIRRALSSFRNPKDILVYNIEEIEKWKNSVNHILARSLREGRLLYERS